VVDKEGKIAKIYTVAGKEIDAHPKDVLDFVKTLK
jgi:peroxiredoxin